MCMAETRIMPSRIPLFFSAAPTCGVMCTYSRCCLVLMVKYSVWKFMASSIQHQTKCDAEADSNGCRIYTSQTDFEDVAISCGRMYRLRPVQARNANRFRRRQ